MPSKPNYTDPESPPPPLLAAPADSTDSGSTIALSHAKDGADESPSTTRPPVSLPNELTRTANSTAAPELQPSVSLRPLRSSERYQIIAEHGRGGLGRVSRAHDRELARDVAIKELISRSRVSEVRFLREALITARLEHPGIVPVHEAGRWPDGTPYYAMKLVSGRPLRELIAERTTVDQRIGLLHHVIAVADAIAYAHGRNIVHRDLKPANVIVGDFGETIVIDWGLAKDLSATEEVTVGGGPFRVPHDGDLSATGAVLGTPTYMAPEQERGERVDQRADVFAIGAMLWELCSLQKVPPANIRQRHRLLRRSGIDKDLIVMLDKALDPDPRGRYADAGALAADLKAFKSGARISARNYSLLAMLVHWTRRHRSFALVAAVVPALTAAGIALYIRDVTSERDRADMALKRTEDAKNDLMLEHAELLLRTDPTAASSALAGYHGPNTTKALQILAEARGRGIAHPISSAHNDRIYLLAGLADNSILSVGQDRRIALTKNNDSTILAEDVAFPIVARYSDRRHLLAYSSTTKGAVLLDLNTRQKTHLTTVAPFAFAFTTDGDRLAILDEASVLTAWNIRSQPQLLQQRRVPHAESILFSGPDRIVVSVSDGFFVGSLDGGKDTVLTVPAEAFDVSAEYLVTGDNRGSVNIFDIGSLKPVASISACRDGVYDLKIINTKSSIVFACQENYAGIIDYTAMTVRGRFATQGRSFGITASDDGRLVILLSDSNIAYIHDVDTQMTFHFEGHLARLSSASGPTSSYPRILTGDIDGAIRAWDAPAADAFIVMQANTSIVRAAVSRDGDLVAAAGADGNIFFARQSTHSQTTVHGHTSRVEGIHFSDDEKFLASYSADGTIAVWMASDLSIVRRFSEHHSRIEDVSFMHHDHQIVSVGDDGRLFRWNSDNTDSRVIFFTALPLHTVEVLANDESLVTADSAGSVWHVRDEKASTLIRAANGDLVTLLRASPDGHFVVVGTERGHVTILDTTTWTARKVIELSGSIRQAAFSSDNSRLAISSERRQIRLIHLTTDKNEYWDEVGLDGRDLSFSPDGRLLAVTSANGGTWFYSFDRNAWTYSQDHYALTSYGRFSSDGLQFVSGDRAGVVVLRNVLATIQLSPSPRQDAMSSSQRGQ